MLPAILALFMQLKAIKKNNDVDNTTDTNTNFT